MSTRYFHIHYMFRGGVGRKTIKSDGMFSKIEFERDISEQNDVENVGLLSFVELTKEDYEVFVGVVP